MAVGFNDGCYRSSANIRVFGLFDLDRREWRRTIDFSKRVFTVEGLYGRARV